MLNVIVGGDLTQKGWGESAVFAVVVDQAVGLEDAAGGVDQVYAAF